MIKGERGIKLEAYQKGDSFIEGLRIVNKKDGVREWVLTARRAEITENGGKAHLSGIEMAIDGRGITVYADKGLYNMADRKLTIDGRVVAKGADYSITSEDAEFDSAAGSLKTEGRVRIDSKKFSVEGKGMDADNSEQKVRIHRDVKAVFYN